MSQAWGKARSALWPVLEQFASPMAQIVLTPYLFHRLSASDFAVWLLAQSLLVAAPTLSLGRSIALLSILPRYGGPARDAAAARLVAQSLRLVAVTLLASFALALAVNAIAASWGLWSIQPIATIALTLILLAATEAESTLTSVLKAYRRFSHSTATELVGRGLQVAATLALVSGGTSVSVALAIAIASTSVKIVVRARLLDDVLRAGASVTAPSVLTSAQGLIGNIGFWSWVNVVSAVAFYSFDRWAVLAFAGSTALAAYAVCQQLAQLCHAVPAAAAQLLVPWTAQRAFSPHASRHRRELALTALWCAVGAGLLPLVMIMFAPQILAFWISPTFAAEHGPLARRLGLAFFLLSLNIPFFSMMIGMGRARRSALITLVASTCGVMAILLVAPTDLLLMADLKLIYAGITLVFVPQFFVAINSFCDSTISHT